MPRFFVQPEQIQGSSISITGSDVDHMQKVLRLKCGDKITVSDGTGREYAACIDKIEQENIIALIEEAYDTQNEPPIEVILLQGLPKGEKMDFIIQKCTELGISKIIPVNMERTIVKLSGDKEDKRRARYQRIAGEAAKQCQRGVVPEISGLKNLGEAIEMLPPDTILIMPWEEEEEAGLKEVLAGVKPPVSLAILIGPEGGITSQEARTVINAGGNPVSLGPRILRTETAGLAVLSIIMYQLGDLGGTACVR